MCSQIPIKCATINLLALCKATGEKMGIKAIFFDIDGTLWDDKFQIPDSTKEAFKLLKRNGHLTFICTGRTRSYIQDERLLSLGFDGIVAGCGTYIEKDKEIIFYKKIEIGSFIGLNKEYNRKYKNK